MIKQNIRGIIATILAIVFIVVLYQAFVVIPRERMAFEKQKIADARLAENVEKYQKEIKYDECVQTAYDEYSMDFNNECMRLGKESGCAILASTEKYLAGIKEKKEARCVQMYK